MTQDEIDARDRRRFAALCDAGLTSQEAADCIGRPLYFFAWECA
jgi:hypothetical protein